MVPFPAGVCRTVKPDASWHSRNSDDLKDRPVKARSAADLGDGLGPCSGDGTLVNYWTQPQNNINGHLAPGT